MYYNVKGQVNHRKQKGKWHEFEDLLAAKLETAIALEYLKSGQVKRMDIDYIKKLYIEIKQEKDCELDELPS